MSSSRTATPFAQAAHSGLTRLLDATPKMQAPDLFGRASAMSRAEMMGRRFTDAIATGVVDDAIDDHRGDVPGNCNPVGGNAGNLPGKLVFALQGGLRRADPDVMVDHNRPPSVSCQATKPKRTRLGLQDHIRSVLRSDTQPERQAALIAYRRGTAMLSLSAKES